MLRVAVLVGGSGSNLQALIDAQTEGGYRIDLVISHVAGVRALERAQVAGIRNLVIAHKEFADRSLFDAAIDEALLASGVDAVCLAGFMRLLGADMVGRWEGRMINIHPALLPAFKGLNTHARALEAGVTVHGCTVHQVTAELDDGPILMQGVVPVLPGDDAKLLAARVLVMEHRCYPRAMALLAAQIDKKDACFAGRRLLVDPLISE